MAVTILACSTAPAPSPSAAPSEGAATATAPAPWVAHHAVDDGPWIAYQAPSTERSGDGVWLIHPDGTEAHEIAIDVRGEHLHPDWSPDGTRLVITSREASDTLYELDLETGDARSLWPCEGSCVGDDEAVWSPDGMRIAFVRAMQPFVEGVPSCALMLGNPENGEVEQLTETKSCAERETFPHWSHDGTRIAYYRGVYLGETAQSTALYVLDVASGVETNLTDVALFAGDSDWSAGDHWILFSTYPLNDFGCCQVSNLYRILPDGTGLEQLTFETSSERRLTQPRFTPDGEALVVTGVTSAGRELWILPFDGRGDPIVVSPGGIFTHGSWQPMPEH